MRMNERGNIILTALFVSIFLFFLSVALIWTNRQDIALSLSMEHKLKAQSAARSAAFEAFARLRQYGSLEGFQGGTYAGGVTAQVELVGLEPNGRRGRVLLLRSKGTSGPLSSYYTMHLLESELASEDNSSDGRVFFFPSKTSESEQGETQSSGGSALYGTFVLEDGGPGVSQDMVAQAGPVFTSVDLAIGEGQPGPGVPPPLFYDYAPVFSEDGTLLNAWGPSYVLAPPFGSDERSVTELKYFEYTGEEFKTVEIEDPKNLGDEDPMLTNPAGAFQLTAPARWAELKLRGVGDTLNNLGWDADKPETTHESDIAGQIFLGNSQQANGIKDWSEASGVPVQQKFVTQGVIAAWGQSVYSHGWHYVYRHYTGSAPGEITAMHGSTLTRWPCILKYQIGSGWSVYWSSLDENGSVKSELKPDPKVLVALSDDSLVSVTKPDDGGARRLLTFSGQSNPQEGREVPEGTLFAYRGNPYLLPLEPETPGLLNLSSNAMIDFSTLPDFLPELYGEVVDTSGAESVITGIEGGYQGEALDTSLRRTVTARPRYDISYSLDSDQVVATDGRDLWIKLDVQVSMLQPSYPAAYSAPPYSDKRVSVLARYDGNRWYVLPNGLRVAMKNSLSIPGDGVVAAVYPGLPTQVNRYSVISIDTRAFRMGL